MKAEDKVFIVKINSANCQSM